MKARIITAIILFGLIFNIVSCSKKEHITLTDIDYNRSISDASDYFDSIKQVEDVFLKTQKTSIDGWVPGPSTFNTVGFLIVAEEVKNAYLSTYDFVETEPVFPDGIDPAVTKFVTFNWCECAEFTRMILGARFVGEVCFDTTNGIIFVNAENT